MFSTFLTISLDDTHSLLSVRASIPQSNPNSEFPANDNGFTDFVNGCVRESTPLFEVDLSESGLRARINQNPVAAATHFSLVLESLCSHLLGHKLDSNVNYDHSRKSIPLQTRPRGIFGQARSLYYVIETQGASIRLLLLLTCVQNSNRLAGRGSLHAHMCVWGSLLPGTFVRGRCWPL